MATQEKLCRRCGEPEREHKYHETKNPNRAGTGSGSRCKGWVDPVQNEVGQAGPVSRPVEKAKH